MGASWHAFHQSGCFRVPASVRSVDDIDGVGDLPFEQARQLGDLVAEAIARRPAALQQPKKRKESDAPPPAVSPKTSARGFERHSIKTLQRMLALNEQATSGTKAELIERIEECLREGGGAPSCPSCQKGRLRLGDESWTCPGFFEGRTFKYCPFKAPINEIARLPWRELEGKDRAAAEHDLRTDK